MKEFLKREAVQKVIATVLKIFAILIMFEFVIFPGLTASNTLFNSFSALLGIVLLFYTVYMFSYEIWGANGIHNAVKEELDEIKSRKKDKTKEV